MKRRILYRSIVLIQGALLSTSLLAHSGHQQSATLHPHMDQWVLLIIVGIPLSIVAMKAVAGVIRARKDR